MKRVFSVIAAIVLVGATWLLTFGQEDVPTPQQNARGSAQAPATKVIFGEAAKSSYLEEYRAIGTARAVQSVAVVADVAGRIESMPNRGSAQIEAGKPLLTLERNVQRINVDIAETRLQQARETVERYRLLQSNGAATVSGVTVHEAATTMAIAAAELELAREEYDRRVIRAPISGQLGLFDLEPGDTLAVGTPIVTIDNTETLIVEFEMPERAVGLLTVGRVVSLRSPLLRGRPLEGEIIAFDSRLDAVTRTITVRARIDNSEGVLWPGMTLDVVMTAESEPMISVPAMAVSWTREGARVWRVDNGKATPVPVLLRSRIDDTVWLEGPLEAGTQIVIEGGQKLRPGAPVTEPQLASVRRDPA